MIVRIRESRAAIVEVPLLVESCLQYEFDQIWVIDCPFQVQIDRLTQRIGDPGVAKSLVSVQIPARVRKFFADQIIRTDVPVSDASYVPRTCSCLRAGLRPQLRDIITKVSREMPGPTVKL